MRGRIVIEGDLSLSLLKTSLNDLVTQHEILRTSFQQLPGMNLPLQVIKEAPRFCFEEHDLTDLDASSQVQALESLWPYDAQKNDEAEDLAPLSLALVRLTEQRHALLLDMPSLYGDAATLKNLLHALSQTYQARQQGEVFTAEPVQYIDISEWQNELLLDEEMAAGLDYWQNIDLADLSRYRLPAEIETPTDVPFRLETYVCNSTEQMAPIDSIAIKAAVPEPVVWLACWQLLLWRLTGQTEVIVGMTYDGRKYDELEEVLGLLAKHLPIRTHLSPQQTFSDYLAQVNRHVEEANVWQECFVWDLTDSDNEDARTPGYIPFCFDFVEMSQAAETDKVSFTLEWQQSCFDRFSAQLTFVQDKGQLQTVWMFDANRLSPSDIAQLAAQYTTIVEQVAARPEIRLGAINVLSQAERQQLQAWNETKAFYPQTHTFIELFSAQVKRTPQATAVRFKDETLTYQALDQQANNLAHYLQKQGVGPEIQVGICLDRSLDMLVSLLGVMKAGGIFVPLDPAYPRERLAFVLQDTQMPILITQSNVASRLSLPENQLLCLDTNPVHHKNDHAGDLAPTVTGDNAAYTIYTSGSTGTPKGVMVTHQSLVNYLHWVNTAVLTSDSGQIPATTKITFDAFLKQLFAPLLRGNEVWLLPEDLVTQPTALWQTLSTHTDVSFNCVPSLWQALLDTLDATQETTPAQHVARLLIGGEALTSDLVQRSLKAIPHLQIWNLYGPTEATSNASAALITDSHSVSIGRPIANTQLYILDQQGQPVSVGVMGKLHIGGVSLARGYLNQPGSTAAKFVPHPLTQEPGARLFNTGDMARYRPDGTIEYLGRIDDQIKLRGYRIELGEIEAVLQQHPGISQSVVTVRESVSGDKRLVAYLVQAHEVPPSLRQLRRFLGDRLPDYMIPSAFVVLERLPLTSSGKVDRQALPTPDQVKSRRAGSLVAPTTPVEEALVEIWSQMLDQPIGIHDNFFELGGDSIVSIRTTALIRKTFQMDIPIRVLFEAPTIARFAQTMSSYEKQPGQVEKVARLLKQVKTMSDTEVSQLLEQKRRGTVS
jgi:amino acid adenylation domain-containing protein